jgi:hypothetical protein
VIEILGTTTAVLASMVVPEEHGASAQRRPTLVRDTDEVPQANHTGHVDAVPFRTPHSRPGMNHVGLLTQHEDHGPTHGHDGEGFVGGVEHQRTGHARQR